MQACRCGRPASQQISKPAQRTQSGAYTLVGVGSPTARPPDSRFACAGSPAGVSIPALRPFKDPTTPSEEETMTAETSTLIRELDRRVSDGIEVRLLWRPHDEVVLVAVSDARTEESFAIEVREGEKALDVFNHPYAYAASRPKLAAIAS
jgi:hypothetical protein